MYNFPVLKSALNTAFTLKKQFFFKDTENVSQHLAVLMKLDLNNSTVPIFLEPGGRGGLPFSLFLNNQA